MKCLVTGGAGFIGSHVVDYLIEEGHNVLVLDDLSSGSKENINKKANFIEKSITDSDLADTFVKNKIELVFHLAAQINVRKSIESPKEDAELNIIGSLNVLNACVKAKVKKIIFSSSGGAAYGDTKIIPTNENVPAKPLSPYGAAKLAIESYIEIYKNLYGLDYTILRYSNVYGDRQNSKGEAGVVSIFVNNALEGKDFSVFGDGEQTRDYVYVKDVAKANMLAIKKSGIFNVSTKTETSINELIKVINYLTAKNNKIVKKDPIKGEIKRSCLDNSKLIKEGWKVENSIKEGLKKTLVYFKT